MKDEDPIDLSAQILNKMFEDLNAMNSNLLTENKIRIGIELELRKKNIELQKALDKTNFLIGEVHHRSKNNLQLLSSLIFLETEINGLDSVSLFADRLQGKIIALGKVHEYLLKEIHETEINLGTYIQETASAIADSFGFNGGLEVSSGTNTVSSDTCSYIGLIINELISNSIKHAWISSSVSKKIMIEVSNTALTFELHYSDNGIGYNLSMLEKNDGHGLAIVRILCNEQLDGEIEQCSIHANCLLLKIPTG